VDDHLGLTAAHVQRVGLVSVARSVQRDGHHGNAGLGGGNGLGSWAKKYLAFRRSVQQRSGRNE
jgi:hypothetical protein